MIGLFQVALVSGWVAIGGGFDSSTGPDPMRRGKVVVGEGAVSPDPRVRREAFARALPEFRAVLDEGPVASPDRLAEARAWIRQLRAESDGNSSEATSVVRVLVVLCPLEGVIRRFNAEKYRALAYKVRDREDPEVARKVRERSFEDVRIGTNFGIEDRNHLKAQVERAERHVAEWSRGELRFEMRVESISGRVSDLRSRPGAGRSLWLLGNPRGREGGKKNTGPPEVYEKLERLNPEDADVVLLVPKYERGDDALPRPSVRQEQRARFRPWRGRTPVAHLGFEARPDGKAVDGAVQERTFALEIVDRVFEALRQSAVRVSLGSDLAEACSDEALEKAAGWWPPCHEKLRIGYRELPVGAEWYEEVLGSWVSPSMIRAAIGLPRVVDGAVRVRTGRVASECFDGDLSTGLRAGAGEPLRIEMRSPVSATAVVLVTGPAGLPAGTLVRLEAASGSEAAPGETLELAEPLRGGVPIRFDLDGELKIGGLSIEVQSGEEDGDSDHPVPVDLREVAFFHEP